MIAFFFVITFSAEAFAAAKLVSSDRPRPTILLVPDQYLTIQEAINNAPDGAQIHVGPGTYEEHITIANERVLIAGMKGAEKTILKGGVTFKNLDSIRSDAPETYGLIGVTITGGEESGVRSINSSPIIKDCIITRNRGKTGGGIYLKDGSAVIQDCTITKNSGRFGGAIYAYSYDLVIEGCTITRNGQNSNALHLALGKMLLKDSTIEEKGSGDSIFASQSRLTLYNASLNRDKIKLEIGSTLSIVTVPPDETKTPLPEEMPEEQIVPQKTHFPMGTGDEGYDDPWAD